MEACGYARQGGHRHLNAAIGVRGQEERNRISMNGGCTPLSGFTARTGWALSGSQTISHWLLGDARRDAS
jgi:hypothetical protein